VGRGHVNREGEGQGHDGAEGERGTSKHEILLRSRSASWGR
jgi:hypothetical protein